MKPIVLVCACLLSTDNMCLEKWSRFTSESGTFAGHQGTKSSHVIVAGDSDDEMCLFCPEKFKCRTLEYVLTSLFQNNLHRIHVVEIHSNWTHLSSQEKPIKIVMGKMKHTPFNILIKCTSHCIMMMGLTFSFRQYSSTSQIRIENVNFSDTRINLFNINVHFNNVAFNNTTITDVPQMWSSRQTQIWLSFSLVQFDGGSNLSLTHSGSVKIKTQNSMGDGFVMVLVSNNLWFQIEHSQMNKSCFSLTSYFVLDAHIADLRIDNDDMLGWENFPAAALSFSSPVLSVTMTEIVASSTRGAVSFHKVYSGLLQSWFWVKISFSKFIRNSKKGPGAAIYVQFSVPYKSDNNYLSVTTTIFGSNIVYRKTFAASYGGAICVESDQEIPFSSHKLVVFVDNSVFSNNFAEDGAGSVFVSGSGTATVFSNCTFDNSNLIFAPKAGVFVITHSNISIYSSIFASTESHGDQVMINLEMLSTEMCVGSLEFTMRCPEGYKMLNKTRNMLSPSTGENMLTRYELVCFPCPPSFYLPTDGNYDIVYSFNQSYVVVHNHGEEGHILDCLDCPQGGDCSGVKLKSRPNFWGQMQKQNIQFYQCVLEYCCVGTCSSFNTCSVHRTGVLCGACEKGFSLSLLSNECFVEHQCTSDSWYWLIFIVVVAIYMLWYTLKDDILSVPQKAVKLWQCRKGTAVQRSKGDKGYFGVLMYFIQAATLMYLPYDMGVNALGSGFLEEIQNFLILLLNVDVMYFTKDICFLKGVDMTSKMTMHFIFYLGIFALWSLCLTGYGIANLCLKSLLKNCENLLVNFKLKIIHGLLEIIKYSYSGICSVVFISVTCVFVGDDLLWWYDGTVTCFSNWQLLMTLSCIVYVVPFPTALVFGLKLLKLRTISNTQFLLGCLVPLPYLCVWTRLLTKQSSLSKTSPGLDVSFPEKLCSKSLCEVTSKLITSNLQGPYRETDGVAEYWESVMIWRRLLLSSTALIPNKFIQFTLCLVLSILFLLHHSCKQPFSHKSTNSVESLSLFFLCMVATINLVKTHFMFSNTHFSPEGPMVPFLTLLQFQERTFVLVLILVMMVLEVKEFLKATCLLSWKRKCFV